MQKVVKISFLGLMSLGLMLGVAPSKSVDAAAPLYCGAFSVKVGDKTYSGDQKVTIPASELEGKTIQVRGDYVEYDVNPATFAVTNYTFTGKENPGDLVNNEKTVIFKLKEVVGSPAVKGDVELLFNGEHTRISQGSGLKLKIQSKDCAQGGIWQLETDEAAIMHHELGDTMRYYFYKNPTTGTSKYMITNGERFFAYESPEGLPATETSAEVKSRVLSMDSNSSYWGVTASGRMGFVPGNDAIEWTLPADQIPASPVIGDVNAPQVLPSDIANAEGIHQEQDRNRTRGGKGVDSTNNLDDVLKDGANGSTVGNENGLESESKADKNAKKAAKEAEKKAKKK